MNGKTVTAERTETQKHINGIQNVERRFFLTKLNILLYQPEYVEMTSKDRKIAGGEFRKRKTIQRYVYPKDIIGRQTFE
jgi:hypothetical protein